MKPPSASAALCATQRECSTFNGSLWQLIVNRANASSCTSRSTWMQMRDHNRSLRVIKCAFSVQSRQKIRLSPAPLIFFKQHKYSHTMLKIAKLKKGCCAQILAQESERERRGGRHDLAVYPQCLSQNFDAVARSQAEKFPKTSLGPAFACHLRGRGL